MTMLKDFRPAALDNAPALSTDHGDWVLAPCSQSRDSDDGDKSNFLACLSLLGGIGPDVEVHRLTHWAVGWVETIVVRPGSDKIAVAEGIRERLESYPILDEEDLWSREYSSFRDDWKTWGYDDFVRALKSRVSEETYDRLVFDVVAETVLPFFEKLCEGTNLSLTSGDIDIASLANSVDISDLEAFLDNPADEPEAQAKLSF